MEDRRQLACPGGPGWGARANFESALGSVEPAGPAPRSWTSRARVPSPCLSLFPGDALGCWAFRPNPACTIEVGVEGVIQDGMDLLDIAEHGLPAWARAGRQPAPKTVLDLRHLGDRESHRDKGYAPTLALLRPKPQRQRKSSSPAWEGNADCKDTQQQSRKTHTHARARIEHRAGGLHGACLGALRLRLPRPEALEPESNGAACTMQRRGGGGGASARQGSGPRGWGLCAARRPRCVAHSACAAALASALCGRSVRRVHDDLCKQPWTLRGRVPGSLAHTTQTPTSQHATRRRNTTITSFRQCPRRRSA